MLRRNLGDTLRRKGCDDSFLHYKMLRRNPPGVTHVALSVTDTEETLELAEESKLKMLSKQNDPSFKEKKVNIAPVDYAALNKLSEHFIKHFFALETTVCRTGILVTYFTTLSEKQPIPSKPVLKKEIPRELPPISLEKDSFNKMKEHVTNFDETITFHTKITGNRIGSWGLFEHGLYKELKEMKVVFNQMETEVAKCSVDKKYFEIEKKELSLDNDRLLEHIICQDIMNTAMHANDHFDNVLPANNNSLKHDNSALELLKHENDHLMVLLISQDIVHTVSELDKKNDIIEKAVYNELLKRCSRLENRCISLEIKLQQNKESFQTNIPSHNQDALEFKEFFTINELQAQLEAKNVSIAKLKEHIANLKGENVVENNNRDAHVDYLKVTQEHTDTLRGIVEQDRVLKLLDNALDYACKHEKRIQELLVCVGASCLSSKYVSETLVAVTPMNKTRKVRVSSSTEASGSKPRSNTKKDRIAQTSSSNKKINKVEDQPKICMTRSSTNELFTPYKEPEREFRSSRGHFKTLSLDELRSLDFNLLSDQEYLEEEVAETMAETMEQYMSKTRADYGSGVARPKIKNKDNFELKGQFLKELRTNTFSGSDHEDANEHIKKVLEIVDLFHIPNITIDQVRLRAFPMSLTGATSRWLRNELTSLITT
ncbi:hypothetical protein Tco_1553421 [Tanacetum coccineum]